MAGRNNTPLNQPPVTIESRGRSWPVWVTIAPSLLLAGQLTTAAAIGAQQARSKLADLDIWGSVSPVGRAVAFVDWSTGDLALRDLESGEDRLLTDKGSWLESPEFGMFPVFSPEAEQIAYTWFNSEGFWELRSLNLDNGEPQLLLSDPDRPYVQPHAWSPDGASILATLRRSDLSNELVLVSAADGSVETLAALDWRVPSTACFVSGSNLVAYDRLPDDGTRRNLYLLPTSGGSDVPLTPDPADHLLLGCSPAGGHLLFASDRDGGWGVWKTRVTGGPAVGDAERLIADVGPIVRGLGVTDDGSLYYGLYVGTTDLYLASLDMVNIRVGIPVRTASSIAFNSTPAWSADGSFVLAQGRDRAGREGYYQVDPRTGEVAPAVQSERCPPACLEWPTLGDDGTLFFTRWTDNGQRLVARDLWRGGERELLSVNAPTAIGPLSLSPDGKLLAVVWRDMRSRTMRLKFVPVEGGEFHDLVDTDTSLQISAIDWMPDSRYLLYATTDAAGNSELWRLPVQHGEPESLGVLFQGLRLYGLRLSPDGQQVAVTAGTPRRSEVWVARRILPMPTHPARKSLRFR